MRGLPSVQGAHAAVCRAALAGLLLAACQGRASAGSGEANASPWIRLDHAAVRLLAAGPGAGPERAAALEVRLDPGTLTYWRQPGDAGLPPRFDTARSENVGAVKVSYPAPELLDEDGAQLFGYRDDVVFPLQVTVAQPNRPAVLAVAFEAAICRTMCLPVSASLLLPLPSQADPEVEQAITAAEASVPRKVEADKAGPSVIRRVLPGAGATPNLEVHLRAPGPATLFVEGPEGWAFPAVPVIPGKEGEAVAEVPILQHPEGTAPAGLPLALTLVGDTGAIEVTLRVDARRPAP